MNIFEFLLAIRVEEENALDLTGATDGYAGHWQGVAPIEPDFSLLTQKEG